MTKEHSQVELDWHRRWTEKRDPSVLEAASIDCWLRKAPKPLWLRQARDEVVIAAARGIKMRKKAGRNFNHWRDYFWWSMIELARRKNRSIAAACEEVKKSSIELMGETLSEEGFRKCWLRHRSFLKSLDSKRRALFSQPLEKDSDVVTLYEQIHWIND